MTADPIIEQTRHSHASIDELLADVFRTAATAGRRRSTVLAAMMGLSRGHGDFTGLEVATEAINIRGAAVRAAGEMGGAALVALYEFPMDSGTRAAEDTAIERCAAYCLAENPLLRDQYFVADAVRDWASKRMHHDYEWWASHLSRNQRHIEYRWSKASRDKTQPTVANLMDRLVMPALARVEVMLEERGIEWMDA